MRTTATERQEARRRYRCSWAIDIWADSPTEAAREAEYIAADPGTARHWVVVEVDEEGFDGETHHVDLNPEEDEE